MGLYLPKTSHDIRYFVGKDGLTSVAKLSSYMFDNVDRTFVGLAPGPLPHNQYGIGDRKS